MLQPPSQPPPGKLDGFRGVFANLLIDVRHRATDAGTLNRSAVDLRSWPGKRKKNPKKNRKIQKISLVPIRCLSEVCFCCPLIKTHPPDVIGIFQYLLVHAVR